MSAEREAAEREAREEREGEAIGLFLESLAEELCAPAVGGISRAAVEALRSVAADMERQLLEVETFT